jgi:hypothetical protein
MTRTSLNEILLDVLPFSYIVIQIPEAILARSEIASALTESRWLDSKVHRGWSYRINPSRPEFGRMRNVHVSRSEHTRAKNKQVSWNQDQSRHNRKTFDERIRGMETAKAIARAALGLPADAILEVVAGPERRRRFLKEIRDSAEGSSPPSDAVVLRVRTAG